jgi:hypothetical protein
MCRHSCAPGILDGAVGNQEISDAIPQAVVMVGLAFVDVVIVVGALEIPVAPKEVNMNRAD